MGQESKHKVGTPMHHSFDKINLPNEVIVGVPIVTITGNLEICIENYKNLIEYTEHYIRVKRRDGEIRIEGDLLKIEYYKGVEMKITGYIKQVEYL